MFEDLPKRSPFKKFFTIVLFLLLAGGAGFFFYQKYAPGNKTVTPKVLPTKIVDSGVLTPSPKSALSATSSPTPSASPTPDYKVPAGETYISSSTADTNGDNKSEILVIAQQADTKFHIYVLDSSNKIVFENKNMPVRPVRISTQTYDPTKDNYLSWMLVMSENSGDLFFIYWTGTAYEIPQNISL